MQKNDTLKKDIFTRDTLNIFRSGFLGGSVNKNNLQSLQKNEKKMKMND